MAKKRITLAIFDLDDTLLHGDSFFLWIEFLHSQEFITKDFYNQLKAKEEAYYRGDIEYSKYLDTYIRSINHCRMDWLYALAWRFSMQTLIPTVKEKAKNLIAQHQAQNHLLVVITATDEMIAKPVVKGHLGIPNLLAVQFCKDEENNRFLPALYSTPSFRQGKVERLHTWLLDMDNIEVNWQDSHFYSDSYNDIFLLKRVGKPVAVDPDEKLRAEAAMRGWPVVSLL